jgi:phosphatidate cytidylyltransferase
MTLPIEGLQLFIGAACVLAFATVAGRVLAWQGGPSLAPTVENLNQRINAWWVMVALLGTAFALGRTATVLLFAFTSFAALREFLTLTRTRRSDHWALLAAFFATIPVQYWLVWQGWYGLFAVFIPVYAFLVMPSLSIVRGDTRDFLARVSTVQWAVMISVFCISHVPALLTLPIPGFEGRQILLVAFLVIVVQGSDVLQYVFGKLFGRHALAPGVSPSKTWEGLVGGVAAATAIGAALWWITPFSPLEAAGMAFVLCLMGFLGGLVFSAIKRDRGVKDWGRMIGGHGGMLDRMDSVIFAAPVFFHFTRYWFTP